MADNDKWSTAYGDELCELFTMTETELNEIEARTQTGIYTAFDIQALLTEVNALRRACYYYSTKPARRRKKS